MNSVSRKNKRGRDLRSALFLLAVATIFTTTFRLYVIIRNTLLVQNLYNLEITVETPQEKKKYNLYTFLLEMESLGIQHARVVLAQNLHEATNPKDRSQPSRIGKGNKNLFGMKVNSRGYAINYPFDPDCREKLPCIDCVHACYSSYEDSLLDYSAWQKIRIRDYERYYQTKVVTDEDYLHMLNNLVLGKKAGYRYAEDPQYTNTLTDVWLPRIDRVIEYHKSHED
jgi:hypothetical protein